MEKAVGWVSPYGRRNESGEAQLNGFVAKFRDQCSKCGEQWEPMTVRIVPTPGRPGRFHHVTCQSGHDE